MANETAPVDSLSTFGNQLFQSALDIAKKSLSQNDTAQQGVDQKAAVTKGKFDSQTLMIFGGISAVVALVVYLVAKK